jgi:proteasome accessory factor B
MQLTESKYERLDAIERLLARRPEGLTTGEIARMLGVNPSTIYRDLHLLESRGTGFIQQGRRYILDHRRSIHQVKLTNNEILALYLAARLLSRHSDEHNPHVVVALEKLADSIDARSPTIARHIVQAATAVRHRRVHREYVEALEILTQAWAEGRKVTLRYRSYQKDEVTERTFLPYFIEPSGIGYACYVIGLDELRGELRTFKVERIRDVRLTGEYFEIPPAFDPQRLLASAWGVVWRDEETIEIVLRFSAQVARRVKESVWHHSQRIEDLPDGACLFTVRVGSTLEITPWIRQWGADVEVLAPDDLRAALIAEVRAMGRMYRMREGAEGND